MTEHHATDGEWSAARKAYERTGTIDNALEAANALRDRHFLETIESQREEIKALCEALWKREPSCPLVTLNYPEIAAGLMKEEMMKPTTPMIGALHSDPCPDCGAQLEDAPGGGVQCPASNCGYWFCY